MSQPLTLPKLYHPDFANPKVKPRGPLVFDESHWLHGRIVAAVWADSSSGKLNNFRPLGSGTNAGGTHTLEHDHYQTGDGGGEYWTVPSQTFATSEAVSIIQMHNLSLWESYGSGYCFSADTDQRLAIQKNPNSLYFNHNSSWNTDPGVPANLNELALVAGTLDATASTFSVWQVTASGGLESGTGSTTVRSSTPHDRIYMGADSNATTTRAVEGKLYFGLLVKGELFDRDVLDMWERPWDWVKPADDLYYFPAAAAPPAATAKPYGGHLLDRQYAAIAAHRLGGVLQ